MRVQPPVRTWSPAYLRPVFYLIGGMLAVLAIAMLVPAAVDASAGHPDWHGFVLSAAVTLVCGGLLLAAARCDLSDGLTLRQAFMLTPMAWLVIALFSALPLYLSDHAALRGSVTDAVFEAMSGLTTTGATVITGLDQAPPGILLWRALLQWMGGIGIIAVAIAILPTLGVGGMQLFRTESSDRSEKVLPRVREIAAAIGAIYLGLTVACALAYWLAGMAPFDAVAHALSTVATGGYSTSDASLGHWQSAAVEWIAVAFMILGALPFVAYVGLVRGNRRVLRNSQAVTFLLFCAAMSVLLAAWLALSGRYGIADAIRHAVFNVVSIVTTAGFATVDYTLWGNMAVGIFFGLLFVGGCTGSTTGGIKIFRFEVMARVLRSYFLQLLYPRGVFPRTYGGKQLPDEVVASVVAFFTVYFLCYGGLTIALMAFDLDFLTSASAAVASLSNVGPGLGPAIGPHGNFASLPDAAKWLLCFAMLLGRLELFAVLVLFMPSFWRG
ncbi:TrkH family potassium uptake protein [Vineibacter terrae]|uniref:TrkH family potassium uptake protein n=1 Tax=Vineibacter terrae TaxID=2586908 RepID=UPI002E34A1C4|nr:TrkH family potassium uptake protein [Vineibacter terrae]HEX2885651.1 TrkH family potassium uptake protein [Vineibacter terrae]